MVSFPIWSKPMLSPDIYKDFQFPFNTIQISFTFLQEQKNFVSSAKNDKFLDQSLTPGSLDLGFL